MPVQFQKGGRQYQHQHQHQREPHPPACLVIPRSPGFSEYQLTEDSGSWSSAPGEMDAGTLSISSAGEGTEKPAPPVTRIGVEGEQEQIPYSVA